MRILTLSNYYPEHQGGIEFTAQNLVRRWRVGHDVRWLACDVREKPHVCEVDDMPMPAWNFAEEHLGFPYPIPQGCAARRIYQHVAWSEVVHLHDCLYFANLVASLAARQLDRPLVVTQHVRPIPYRDATKNALQHFAYSTAGKCVLENAALAVFVNEAVMTWFATRIHLPGSSSVIPNGVDWQVFHRAKPDEREACRSSLGFSKKDLICLFVGRFTEKKGLDLVRLLAKSRPQLRWILIGAGELEPRAWRLPNVQVISPVSQAQLRQYYIAADLFVLPSVGEGFPLAVQEAMACGLPVTVTRQTAQALSPVPLLELDTSTPLAMRASFDEICSDRQRLLELGVVAAAYARRWDWDVVSAEYEAIFESLGPRSRQRGSA